MMESNYVSSLIVLQFKVRRDEAGKVVDETYYKKQMGNLMYLSVTRPSIIFVTCLICRYMTKPTQIHLQLAKRGLGYLKRTMNNEIHYKKGGDGELSAFTDINHV